MTSLQLQKIKILWLLNVEVGSRCNWIANLKQIISSVKKAVVRNTPNLHNAIFVADPHFPHCDTENESFCWNGQVDARRFQKLRRISALALIIVIYRTRQGHGGGGGGASAPCRTFPRALGRTGLRNRPPWQPPNALYLAIGLKPIIYSALVRPVAFQIEDGGARDLQPPFTAIFTRLRRLGATFKSCAIVCLLFGAEGALNLNRRKRNGRVYWGTL